MNNFSIVSTNMTSDGRLVVDFEFKPVKPLDYINLDVMITKKQTIVHDWRFETGDPKWVGQSAAYPAGWQISPSRGWYCSVYPEDNDLFIGWMIHNCPTADVTHRFNSGNPMWTVRITDEREATVFNLRWL